MIVVNEMEQVASSEKKIEKSPWLPDDRPTAPKVKKSVFQGKKKYIITLSIKLIVLIHKKQLHIFINRKCLASASNYLAKLGQKQIFSISGFFDNRKYACLVWCRVPG